MLKSPKGLPYFYVCTQVYKLYFEIMIKCFEMTIKNTWRYGNNHKRDLECMCVKIIQLTTSRTHRHNQRELPLLDS